MFERWKRSRGAAVGATLGSLLTVGCGGDGSAGAMADLSVFVGTWDVTDGSATATCGGLEFDEPLTGEVVTVTEGPTGGLVANMRGCPLELEVVAGTARAREGQTCTTTLRVSGLDTAIVLTVKSATFSVDGATGALVQSGTATTSSLVQATCSYEAQATGKKRSATG